MSVCVRGVNAFYNRQLHAFLSVNALFTGNGTRATGAQKTREKERESEVHEAK